MSQPEVAVDRIENVPLSQRAREAILKAIVDDQFDGRGHEPTFEVDWRRDTPSPEMGRSSRFPFDVDNAYFHFEVFRRR